MSVRRVGCGAAVYLLHAATGVCRRRAGPALATQAAAADHRLAASAGRLLRQLQLDNRGGATPTQAVVRICSQCW